jgi:hypothetical protein
MSDLTRRVFMWEDELVGPPMPNDDTIREATRVLVKLAPQLARRIEELEQMLTVSEEHTQHWEQRARATAQALQEIANDGRLDAGDIRIVARAALDDQERGA